MEKFSAKIAGTAIANQAILKCVLAGMPLTIDNALLFIGDFFHPDDPQYANIIPEIEASLTAVIGVTAIQRQ